jgi:hypothetical protein
VSVDRHRLDCAAPTALVVTAFHIVTGGGDDVVRFGLPNIALIDGGPGDDVLHAGPGPDLIYAGAGADHIHGHGGDDRLFDGSLRDPRPTPVDSIAVFPPVILAPGRGRDWFDGGRGSDTLTYEGRSGRLRIDLASPRAVSGVRGERDLIKRVENATGGSGNDRLQGDRGVNYLDGGGGEDRLAGRGGADNLFGNAGSDVISGGPGNDRIDPQLDFPTIPAADRVRCGRGRDLVGGAYPDDFLEDDCERVGLQTATAARLNAFALRSHLPLRRRNSPRVLSGALSCFSRAEVCQVAAEVRVRGAVGRGGTAPARGTLLGTQALSISGPGPSDPDSSGVAQPMDLRLSADGLRILRRHRALRARVTVRTQYTGPVSAGYVTVLRAP